jgi:ABC-type Mn2+/Zn2+ transport system ATPase subunit
MAAVVEAQQLAVGYGSRAVLEGVDFTVQRGQRVGILGPNGGGKTTLFRVLLGELAPWHGSVSVRARIGVVAQTDRSRLDLPVSALDVVLLGTIPLRPWWRHTRRSDRRRATDALQRVGLAGAADAGYGELSGGQRQRVLIARALAQDAEVLLLDEPFTGLDTASRDRLERLIDDLAGDGRTLMIATHDIAQTASWDRVLCLHQRQIAYGPPAVALSASVLEATYGQAVVRLAGGEGALAVVDDHGCC